MRNLLGAALAVVVGVPQLAAAQECGDVNGTGGVTASDALLVLNEAVGLPVELTCAGGRFPASGQITSYGPGSDGDVQAGAPLSYTDNGDGTITDNNTGLMWEKKDDSTGIHDKDNVYTWSTGTNDMDGTISTLFLASLNAAGGFAGYTDWRIPNVKELQSIINYEVISPSVDPAFHQSTTCTVCIDVTLATCSCTARFGGYWSSTHAVDDPSDPGLARLVDFRDGDVYVDSKTNTAHVRVVRDAW